MRDIGALYVHVPYCAQKCAYCDFASGAVPAGDPCLDAYARTLVRRLRVLGDMGYLAKVRTAYIGGGTPTYLGAENLGLVVAAVRAACPGLVELSVEANPDSLDDDVLDAAASAGASRLSIGVQSFCDGELKALGRIHTADTACRRVAAAVDSGLDVSVDLMCATPRQTDASWQKTLETAVELGVDHVSVYPLSLEEGTPLGDAYRGRDPSFNDEDVQADRMEQAEKALCAAGYARYEVASYARPTKQCAHNICYWTGVPYLGLGPGAASMLEGEDLGAYRIRFVEPEFEPELLSAHEAEVEDLMLGMRLTDGVEASRFAPYPDTLADLLARGLVELRAGRVVPTHEGWLLGNELYGTIWDLAQAD